MTYYKRPPVRPALVLTAALAEEAARLRGLPVPALLLKRDRTRKLAYTRFGIIWVMRQFNTPYQTIRDQLNFKDHTSVMYGHDMAAQFREEDPEYRQFTDDLLSFALSYGPKVVAEAA